MKDKLDDSLGPEILQELEDLQENYPKVVELMVTMIAAITDVAGNVHNLSRLTDHLEVSRLDHSKRHRRSTITRGRFHVFNSWRRFRADNSLEN